MVEVAVTEKTTQASGFKARDHMDLPRGWCNPTSEYPIAIKNHTHYCGPYKNLREAIGHYVRCDFFKYQGNPEGPFANTSHCEFCLADAIMPPTMRNSIQFPWIQIDADGGIMPDRRVRVIAYSPVE